MIENISWFIIGMVVSQLFKYVMSLGLSVRILKQTQKSCAALFVLSEQGLQQVLELKYIEMKEAKKSEQNIIAQRHIDQVNLDSIKGSIMRNYVSTFPQSYAHIMDYTSWKELENFVIKETNKGDAE
tara:strand:+ start:728 stop:1108 length:381 start_codon:yes stop_codon:yes gene_type:complete